jgi:pimeloyl-ACP methyl ester carboxylesterase
MVWRKIQARVASFSRVCAFDKAGFGHSDATSRPSSVGYDVDDLHRLIVRSGIASPVVLVGHSLGGEDAVLFAGRYRRVVAGMVLVDPAFADQNRAWSAGRSTDDLAKHRQMDQAALADAAQCLKQAQAGTLTRATDKLGCLDEDYADDPVLQAELDRQEMMAQNQAAQMSESENSTALATVRPSIARDPFESQDDRDAAGAPTDFGGMPLIVLSRDIDAKCVADPACAKGEGNWWKAAHDRLAKYSTIGRSITVVGAGHVIMEDQPDAVVDAVRDVVLAVRQKP